MKYILLVLVIVLSTNTYSYSRPDVGSERYIKAEKRADKHPKGSGVGTNKYNIDYNADYYIEDFKRYIRK